jgi:hypothetical protein
VDPLTPFPAGVAFVCWSSLDWEDTANLFVLSDDSGDVAVTLTDARFYCAKGVRTQARVREGWQFLTRKHFRNVFTLRVTVTAVHTLPLQLPMSARSVLHS